MNNTRRIVRCLLSLALTLSWNGLATAQPAPPTAPTPPAGADTALQAGWHNGNFYISDPTHDWFVIPTGRLQLDGLYNVGDRVSDEYLTSAGAFHRADVSNGILLRRARVELAGMLFGRFNFLLGGELTSGSAPIATDLFVNARVVGLLNFQLGQFDAPFTLENRTSDKYIDFMERSLAVRALGIPTNKEIGLMAWGETRYRMFYYSVGMFNGDGPNQVNRDAGFDVMGRLFMHPLIGLGGLLANVQVGGSFRYGYRGRGYDIAYPRMTTQGGFQFFNPAHAGGMIPTTVVPDSAQVALAAELDVPIARFDFRGELVWVQNDTREMMPPSLAGSPVREGELRGLGYYLQLGYWLWGTPGVNGRPGYQNPPSLRLEQREPLQPPQGLQLIARFDAVDFRYEGGSRTPFPPGMPRPDESVDGRYTVYALEFGANFWASKHVRLSLNYMHYLFPGQPAGSAVTGDENHLPGPHNNPAGFGELMARVGLAI